MPKKEMNEFDWTFVQGSTFMLSLDFNTKIHTVGNTKHLQKVNNIRIIPKNI
jgi:hypothetical protein